MGSLVLAMGVWAFGHLGYWLSEPESSPCQADVIVVLGGGERYRLQKALTLYKESYAGWILLTGSCELGANVGESLHHWRIRLLVAQGVPREAIVCDDHSRNSYEEAHNTATMMQERRWKSALVVSDPPHLRRLEMIWSQVASRYGIEYRLIASEPPTWNAARWWEEKVWTKFVGMELVKLAYYAVVY